MRMELDFFRRVQVSEELATATAQVRERASAVWNPLMRCWMVGGYHDVKAVYGDTLNFTSEGSPFGPAFGLEAMLIQDGGLHDALRKVWTTPFSASGVRSKRSQLVSLAGKSLEPSLAAYHAGETVDLVAVFEDFVARMITMMMGVATDRRQDFKRWNRIITDLPHILLPDDHPKMAIRRDAKKEVYTFLDDEVRNRIDAADRGEAADDIIGLMVAAEGRNGIIRSTVLDNLLNLLLGALDTTVRWMGNAIVILNENREILFEVRANRTLLPKALEEVVRLQSVIQLDVRKAKSDAAFVGDVLIPQGDTIFLMLGAANRDPLAFENPDSFDLDRPKKLHLGFGFGMHVCLGMNMARIEAEIMLNLLFDELQDFDIVGVDYGDTWGVWGPKSLLIRSVRRSVSGSN
jgi:cytochrome P450